MKKSKSLILLIVISLFLLLIPTVLFVLGLFYLKPNMQILIGVSYVIWLIILISLVVAILKVLPKRLNLLKNSLNYYTEQEIAKHNLGLIIFTNSGEIIWTSDFIRKRFGDEIIGKNIKRLLNINEWTNDNQHLKMIHENSHYEVFVNLEKNIATLQDETIMNQILKDYESQRIVYGEISIDNLSLFQSTLSEEELFKIYTAVVNILKKISKKYDLVYRQYENGHYLVIITKETLDQFEANEFSFLNKISDSADLPKDIKLTLSAGFAYGIYRFDVLSALAKSALLQSETRGGNQVTVLTKNEKPRNYGSFSEIQINESRTNVAFIAQTLIEKIQSKSINKVIIYGHKNADLDALGSSYALWKLSKAFGKEAYIQNKTFDDTTQRIINSTLIENRDEIFVAPKEATKLNDDNTLVILTDNSELQRIENKLALKNIRKENIFVLDHHRIAKNPDYVIPKNTHIDSSASSASEIVTEIISLTSNSDKIDAVTAQLLLDGIYLDTNIFKKQTSFKTFQAASILSSWGASTKEAVLALKVNEEIYQKINHLLKNLQEVKPGFYLAYAGDIVISNDIIAAASDEILRVEGRKAAFVVGKLPTGNYKMSARGINTNVQVIAEAVNGGGHFGTAAAESDETLEVFIDNIKQAIVSVKNESNID
ncbi:c-di-AMP phosphodiesterase-like protein [Metamycoplasma subdolum]|uniref:C-di-AMP phosphodiesterase-like protein n=1 Tax=Metamycoplasma subdolum TaxID=92407 RepID=A0A3L9ZYB0_9BACT|nr:DHH family phosphoesterase [Metamycoplasma subdolum]RMA77430.1 c-di-AMP phosphodiesterase-like protein [Metamycoplasma subdolum]WPB50394.1 DHH family phosphoesterase [Metamycoplasma subdolum]